LLVLDLEYLDSSAIFDNTSMSEGARSVPNAWRLCYSPGGKEISNMRPPKKLEKTKTTVERQ
jgi:hypothetical protein